MDSFIARSPRRDKDMHVIERIREDFGSRFVDIVLVPVGGCWAIKGSLRSS